MDLLIYFGVFLILLTTGYFAGSIREKRHYQSIIIREQELLDLPTTSMTYKAFSKSLDMTQFKEVKFVSGGVVIAVDYFKVFLALLRNIFGGTVTSYETLVDRARREAILRMKKRAGGANMIINMRIETSTIGNSADDRGSVGSIEAFAYGTALYK